MLFLRVFVRATEVKLDYLALLGWGGAGRQKRNTTELYDSQRQPALPEIWAGKQIL